MQTDLMAPVDMGQRAARFVVSPTGSPFVYQNTQFALMLLLISGGTLIAVSRDGLVFDTLALLSTTQVLLAYGDMVRITYLTAPTIVAIPL